MKRVIKGKRYDTDKATLVGEHVAGEPGQPEYTREALYKKRGGEYFVRVQGPYTLDAVVPLSVQEAGNWVLDNKGKAAYTEEFCSQGVVSVNVRLTLACKRMVDRMANETGTSRSQVMEDCVRTVYSAYDRINEGD